MGSVDVQVRVAAQLLKASRCCVFAKSLQEHALIKTEGAKHQEGKGTVLGLDTASHGEQELLLCSICPSIRDSLTALGGLGVKCYQGTIEAMDRSMVCPRFAKE